MLMRPFGRAWAPWSEMERLRREVDRLMSGTSTWPGLGIAPGYPAMNVWTNEDGAVVTAELPGVDPAELDISVQNDTLTLRGNRQPAEAQEDATYHRRERSSGHFVRSIQLPFTVDSSQVQASYEKGILSVTLPRAEADKPLKIAIKAG